MVAWDSHLDSLHCAVCRCIWRETRSELPLLLPFILPFLTTAAPTSTGHAVTHLSRIAYILGTFLHFDSATSQCVKTYKGEKLNIKGRAEPLGVQSLFWQDSVIGGLGWRRAQ